MTMLVNLYTRNHIHGFHMTLRCIVQVVREYLPDELLVSNDDQIINFDISGITDLVVGIVGQVLVMIELTIVRLLLRCG